MREWEFGIRLRKGEAEEHLGVTWWDGGLKWQLLNKPASVEFETMLVDMLHQLESGTMEAPTGPTPSPLGRYDAADAGQGAWAVQELHHRPVTGGEIIVVSLPGPLVEFPATAGQIVY